MAKMIPNENCTIRFATAATLAATTPTSLSGTPVNLTGAVISITASATGNVVPTPTLDSLFETSVPGTSAAQFSIDMYRDDVSDAAWDALPRGTKGYFGIVRYLGATEEVWPVIVTSRAAGPLSSNTAETFTVTCSVPMAPFEG